MERIFSSSILALVLLALAVSASTFPTGLTRPSPVHAAVSGFVTRSGSRLQLNGNPFRFSGTNIYWMALDENAGASTIPRISASMMALPPPHFPGAGRLTATGT